MPCAVSPTVNSISPPLREDKLIVTKPICVFWRPISTTITRNFGLSRFGQSSRLYFSLDFNPLIYSILMEPSEPKTQVYSVWAVPPDDMAARFKKLMEALKSEFGGPQFQPHVTVVGAISLTEQDALDKFRSACDGLKGYHAVVDRVATGNFFYQCVFLLLHSTPEVLEASAHCCGQFGYNRHTPYMPHLSLLYADLTEEEKKKAQEKANSLDESINGLSFPINRLQLWKTDTEDTTLRSWEKVAEYTLPSN